ncbi:MAG: AbfB domain-containing protein [Xanthomonadales bacterium]|jgi:hypothetical protein|nr:AbfB domain-containing protein [Xanthomonadales bacterium]
MKTRNCSQLAVLALCASLAPAAMAQVSRTPWQMHPGDEGVITKLALTNPTAETLPAMFDRATIPAEGAGWGAAPDTEIIGFGNDGASQIKAAGGSCLTALDYTYFQTFVDVPAGTTVNEFKIIFDGMDDASRITVFNSAHPNGLVVAGSYVTKAGAVAATTDLRELMSSGRNRVVITQVDWCPGGNKLRSAKVELNGSTIAASPDPEPAMAGGTLVSLQSVNYPDRYVRHRSLQGYLEPVGSDLDRKDSSFRRVAGLADRNQVSFEAANYPGWFLVAEGDKAMLRQRPAGNPDFDRGATFVIRGGLSDPAGISLESLAQSGKYLRHFQFGLFIHVPDGSDLFNMDATFLQVAPNCGTQCAP